MSDPSRTETLTAERVQKLRERASAPQFERRKSRPWSQRCTELCDSHEAIRAELARFQDAHRAQEQRIKALEQENAKLRSYSAPHRWQSYPLADTGDWSTLCSFCGIEDDGQNSGDNCPARTVEQAEAREQATRDERDALRAAVHTFLLKLDTVEQATMGIYTLALVHGPSYAPERDALLPLVYPPMQSAAPHTGKDT